MEALEDNDDVSGSSRQISISRTRSSPRSIPSGPGRSSGHDPGTRVTATLHPARGWYDPVRKTRSSVIATRASSLLLPDRSSSLRSTTPSPLSSSRCALGGRRGERLRPEERPCRPPYRPRAGRWCWWSRRKSGATVFLVHDFARGENGRRAKRGRPERPVAFMGGGSLPGRARGSFREDEADALTGRWPSATAPRPAPRAGIAK